MAVLDDNTVMLPVGTLLHERYRIERYLASGGFGNTYVAHDTLFDEKVAVKEFFMRTMSQRDAQSLTVSVSNPSNRPSFDSQLRKFRVEAKRVRKLKNDHIVHVHDLFDEFGTSYYVMDYIDGESLSARLKRRGEPFDENTVRNFLDQMLDALSEPHRHSIWHLDVKPGNMMLSSDGKLTLIDFGASKLTDQSGDHATSSMMAYTAGYAPIEQIEQRIDAIGAHTDLYALGASLYNLLTCQNPPERSRIDDEGDEAFHYPDDTSEAMRQLIRYMMQPLRRNRPQSIKQVRQFIAANHLEPSAQPVVPAAEPDDVTVIAVAKAENALAKQGTERQSAEQTPQPENNNEAPDVEVTAVELPKSEQAPKPAAKAPKAEPAPKVETAAKAEPAPKPDKLVAKAEPSPKPQKEPESKPESKETSKKGFKKVAVAIGIAALLAVIAAVALNRCNSGTGIGSSEGPDTTMAVEAVPEAIEATVEPAVQPETQPAPAAASEHSKEQATRATKADAKSNKTTVRAASTKNNQSKGNFTQKAQKTVEKQQTQQKTPKVGRKQGQPQMPKPQGGASNGMFVNGGGQSSTQRQRHEPGAGDGIK